MESNISERMSVNIPNFTGPLETLLDLQNTSRFRKYR